MLTQNSELKEIGVWNWSIPAWVVTLTDGTTFNTCPSAGACAALCYARNGTYLFPKVRGKHIANLEMVLDDLDGWADKMVAELARKKYRPTGQQRPLTKPEGVTLDDWMEEWCAAGGRAVRIHDAGDFFSDEYLQAWMNIARATPDVLFYAYTKEVEMFRRLAVPLSPPNFRWLWSLGGRQDHRIDLEIERHADVFPDEETLVKAGYESQEASDLYAITLQSKKVGIAANNIRHFKKRQGQETFGTLQANRHA